MKKLLTLSVIHTDTHVLLGMKKRGFGEGRWNGFGGKVLAGEGIEQAAQRELREEAGILMKDPRPRGLLTFEFAGDPTKLEVHVFSASAFEGVPAESEEMRPQWFRLSDVPYTKMWADDKYWLPVLLKGRDFKGHFYFLDQDNLLNYRLEEAGIPAHTL
jgi:8-oxo-dGTP pyrophosphatase MutT (NUDIX family)